MIPSEDPPSEHGPTALILGAVFGAAAMVALLATGRGAEERPTPAQVEPSGDDSVRTAPSYAELLARRNTGRDFDEVLARLPASLGSRSPSRSANRAFAGAPPTIPHPVDPRGPSGCRSCHDRGMAFPNGDRAPRMSHEPLTVCTQCHVPSSWSWPRASGGGS